MKNLLATLAIIAAFSMNANASQYQCDRSGSFEAEGQITAVNNVYESAFSSNHEHSNNGCGGVITPPDRNPNPVPLPAAVWLFLAGLMGVNYLAKRKK